MELASSRFFPEKTIKHFDLLPSTNDFAANWCQADVLPPEGSLVITDNQSAGKGQGTNQWMSESHQNLTFSMIYYPGFLEIKNLFALNMITSLAVLDVVLAQKIPKASVKWPNDVLIDTQKVAGILIRNSLTGKKIALTIIGIGLNVNQTIFPKGISNATSLNLAAKQKINKTNILNYLIESFETRYLDLKSGKYKKLKQEYLSQLFLMNQESTFFLADNTEFTGTIMDIKDSGHLVMSVNGRLKAFDFREIRFGF